MVPDSSGTVLCGRAQETPPLIVDIGMVKIEDRGLRRVVCSHRSSGKVVTDHMNVILHTSRKQSEQKVKPVSRRWTFGKKTNTRKNSYTTEKKGWREDVEVEKDVLLLSRVFFFLTLLSLQFFSRDEEDRSAEGGLRP